MSNRTLEHRSIRPEKSSLFLQQSPIGGADSLIDKAKAAHAQSTPRAVQFSAMASLHRAIPPVRTLFLLNQRLASTLSKSTSLISQLEESVASLQSRLADAGYGRRLFLSARGNTTQTQPLLSFTALAAKHYPEGNISTKTTQVLEAILSDPEPHEQDFCRLLLTLAQIQAVAEAELLFKHARRHFPVSSDLFSAMLYCYGKAGEYSRAMDLFRSESDDSALLPSRRMYHCLMEAYGTWLERRILADESEETSINSSSSAALVRRSDPMFPLLLEERLKRLSLDPLLTIYEQLIASRLSPSIETITIVLRASARVRRADAIYKMLQEAERYSLSFDVQAYEVLIFAWFQCRKPEKAFETHTEAVGLFKHQACKRLLAVMLWGLCRGRDLEGARRIVDEYAEHGIHPQPSALSYLVSLTAGHDRVTDATAWMDRLEKRLAPLPPASITYNQLLSMHARLDRLDAFMQTIRSMRAKGVRGDKFTRTMLFDVLGRLGDAQLVQAEFAMLKLELSGAGASPSSHLTPLSAMELGSLLGCLFKLGGQTMIGELITLIADPQWLNQLGLVERFDVNLALLRAFSLTGDWDRAMALTGEMLAKTTATDTGAKTRILRSFLAALIEDGKDSGCAVERVEAAESWMRSHRVWRDRCLIAQLMRAFLLAGRFDRTEEIWREAVDAKKGTLAALEAYGEGLAAEGRWTELGMALETHGGDMGHWAGGLMLLHMRRLGSINDLAALQRFFFTGMASLGTKPGTLHCNALLAAAPTETHRVVQWMLANSVYSNVDTINILLLPERIAADGVKWAMALVDAHHEAGRRTSKEQLMRLCKALHSSSLDEHLRQKAQVYTRLLEAYGKETKGDEEQQ